MTKNQITFNDYVNVLFNKTKLIKSQFSFRSTTHDIDTEKVNKIEYNVLIILICIPMFIML